MKEKDTIFLSHSSKDKESLNLLKKLLVDRTSNIFNVFLSSDGQSIPFGTNWIHKIEEGLNNAKVMFIFVTPNSVKSGWIYFEAGYAYSKGIKVIPIGIGVDIGSINPPLNLLQGFNITSKEGLNNIIKIINDIFDVTFLEDFIDEEYFEFSSYFISDYFNLKNQIIDYFKTEINNQYYSNGEKKVIDLNNLFVECHDIFDENYISYLSDEISFLSNGLQVKKRYGAIEIAIDIDNIETNIKTFKDIIKLANKESESHYLSIILKQGYDVIIDEIKVSSLITKSDYITFGSGSIHSYKYKNVSFALFRYPKTNVNSLNVVIKQDTDIDTIYDLVNELYNVGIIFKEDI